MDTTTRKGKMPPSAAAAASPSAKKGKNDARGEQEEGAAGVAARPMHPRKVDSDSVAYLRGLERELERLLDIQALAGRKGSRARAAGAAHARGRQQQQGEDDAAADGAADEAMTPEAMQEAREQASVLVDSILHEIRFKTASAAFHRHGSVVLEKVCLLAKERAFVRLLSRLVGYGYHAARSRYASHMLEVALARAAIAVSYPTLPSASGDEGDEARDQEEDAEEDEDEEGEEERVHALRRQQRSLHSLTAVLKALAQELQPSVPELISDISACHVIRAMVCALAGLPPVAIKKSAHAKHSHPTVDVATNASSTSSHIVALGAGSVVLDAIIDPSTGGIADSAVLGSGDSRAEFTAILASYFDAISGDGSEEVVRRLQRSSTSMEGAITLALLTRIAATLDMVPDGAARWRRLVGAVLNWPMDDNSEQALQAAGRAFYAMAGERSSSIFLQAIVETAPDDCFAQLLSAAFQWDASVAPAGQTPPAATLQEYATDGFANFVLQSLMRRAACPRHSGDAASAALSASAVHLFLKCFGKADALGRLAHTARWGVVLRLLEAVCSVSAALRGLPGGALPRAATAPGAASSSKAKGAAAAVVAPVGPLAGLAGLSAASWDATIARPFFRSLLEGLSPSSFSWSPLADDALSTRMQGIFAEARSRGDAEADSAANAAAAQGGAGATTATKECKRFLKQPAGPGCRPAPQDLVAALLAPQSADQGARSLAPVNANGAKLVHQLLVQPLSPPVSLFIAHGLLNLDLGVFLRLCSDRFTAQQLIFPLFVPPLQRDSGPQYATAEVSKTCVAMLAARLVGGDQERTPMNAFFAGATSARVLTRMFECADLPEKELIARAADERRERLLGHSFGPAVCRAVQLDLFRRDITSWRKRVQQVSANVELFRDIIGPDETAADASAAGKRRRDGDSGHGASAASGGRNGAAASAEAAAPPASVAAPAFDQAVAESMPFLFEALQHVTDGNSAGNGAIKPKRKRSRARKGGAAGAADEAAAESGDDV